MQILLADAKTMRCEVSVKPHSIPRFAEIAGAFAGEMTLLSVPDLEKLLGGSRKVNEETQRRYRDFFATKPVPAILAYTGQAYRHLRAETLSEEALCFAQNHLFITSFLYGLLRPLDGIVPYRMEQFVKLDSSQGLPMSHFWRDLLTEPLINAVNSDDGVLLQLSTEEFEQLYDRKKVSQTVRVVKPWFYVRKNGSLKVQAVWAKTCRGAMLRYILEHQISQPKELKSFAYKGFEYAEGYGDAENLYFIREEER